MSTLIEDVQSWWQVPAIAHFCYIYQKAFYLCKVDIGELEAAILNLQDPEICYSLEEIVIPILQGCFKKLEITSENWEDKMKELFEDNLDSEDNPLEKIDFSSLTPRQKVDAIYKLCEIRLDMDGVMEITKDIPAEKMQASCIGQDSNDNVYWYFFDERLYKEDPVATKILQSSQAKGRNSKKPALKLSKRAAQASKAKKSEGSPWSIACHNITDWENLSKQFSKSKHPGEKAIVKAINDKYFPLLENIVAEKERRLRKRLLELAPKRTSARIGKVQEKKKLEAQIAAEAAEKYRLKREKAAALKEEKRKEEVLHGRQRRAEEREKKKEERMLERIRRIEQRSLRASDSDSNSQDYCKPFKAQKAWHTYIQSLKTTPLEDSNEQEEDIYGQGEDSNGQGEGSNGQGEDSNWQGEDSNEQGEDSNSSDEPSPAFEPHEPVPKRQKIYERVTEDFENSVSVTPTRTVSGNLRTYSRSSVIQASHSYSIWNPELSSLVPSFKVQNSPVTKKIETNTSAAPPVPVSKVQTVSDQIKKPENKVIYYMDSNSLPFRQRSVNAIAKCPSTTSPSVIRINIIKAPANIVTKQVSSFTSTTFNNQAH